MELNRNRAVRSGVQEVMRKRRLLLVATFVGAAVVAIVLTANAVVLHGGTADSKAHPMPEQADCALVLGAFVRPDGSPSDVLRDRLDEAIAVWRAGRVKTILVSGDHHTPGYDEPNAMRRYLEAQGVPPEIVFMDHAGVDTYSSVWRAKHVFGASRVVVVTQRFHLSRAVWVARSLGLDADGSAADRHVYRSIAWLQMREVGSRTKAFVDVLYGREASIRHRGAPIDLGGDGRVTAG